MSTWCLEGKGVDESTEMIPGFSRTWSKNTEKDLDQLVPGVANYLSHQQKSRAFYPDQATRMMTGAGNILKKHAAEQAKDLQHERCMPASRRTLSPGLLWPDTLTSAWKTGGCAAPDGEWGKAGTRQDPVCGLTKQDGSANAGEADYEFTEGTVVLKPGETQKRISLWASSWWHFEGGWALLWGWATLLAWRRSSSPRRGCLPGSRNSLPLPRAVLVSLVLGPSHHLGWWPRGHLHFWMWHYSCQWKHWCHGGQVLRTSGAGAIIVPFGTVEGTAKKGGGEDFEDIYGELEFRMMKPKCNNPSHSPNLPPSLSPPSLLPHALKLSLVLMLMSNFGSITGMQDQQTLLPGSPPQNLLQFSLFKLFSGQGIPWQDLAHRTRTAFCQWSSKW